MKKFSEFLDDPKNRLILWIFTGIIIFLVGVLSPKAETIQDSFIIPSTAQFYDNSNGTLTNITTDYINNSGDYFYMSYAIFTPPNASGAAIGFNLNEPLIAGYTYTLSISVGPIGCGTTRLSSYNRLGVHNSLASAKSAYQNGGNSTISFSDYQGLGYKGLSYAFTPSVSGTYIVIPYTTQYNCNDVNYFYGYTINNLGPSNSVTQNDINTSINNQTTVINNAISNSESNIINEVIQSSEETQNAINENFNTCVPSETITFTTTSGYELDSNGNPSPNSNWLVTDFIPVKEGYTYTFSGFSSNFTPLYNSNHQSIGVRTSNSITIPVGSGVKYIRRNSTINGYNGSIIQEEYCTNRLDNVNDSINDVNDTLNDDDTTGATDEASDFFSSFSTDTFGLTSIITAPLNLIQSLTSSTCTALHIPLPYLDNKYIDLPCMTSIYESNFGSFFTMYQTITFGIIAYWVCVRIFNQVKDFKNPEHDEIEVLDL